MTMNVWPWHNVLGRGMEQSQMQLTAFGPTFRQSVSSYTHIQGSVIGQARQEEREKAYLENSALDHDLHPVWRNTRYLVDRVLEQRRGLIGVELHVVDLPGMLYFDGNGRHCVVVQQGRCRRARSVFVATEVDAYAHHAQISMTNLPAGTCPI